MAKKQIKEANNNIERQETYRNQLGRYKRAMANGFYFEAMMIVYSMLEDRLKSFLYYCGFFASRSTLKLNSKIKQAIIPVVYGEYIPARLPGFDKISAKVIFIRGMLKWATDVDGADIQDEAYLSELKRQLECIDIGGMLEVLDELNDKESGWLNYRNEIIHASLNKNIESLYSEIEEHVIKGMEYARFIDDQVRVFRGKPYVRKMLGLQNN